jgi:S1-C subfamily serine protease
VTTGNVPLQDPNSVAAPTPLPPSNPNTGGSIPSPNPSASPSPRSGPIGPDPTPNSTTTESLPTLPTPAAANAAPQGPQNPDDGIPANTFGHLGITVAPSGNDGGLSVVGIERTSPAYPAALLIGDEITSINGQRITRFADLVKGLRAAAQSDGNVSLLVRRRGTVDTINVMVGGKTAQVDRPRLGVTLDDSNGQLRVTQVTPNSPAAAAGVQAGDEIITVNDYPVSTFDLFVGQIQAIGRAGGHIPLGVRRGGKMITLQATISAAQKPALPKSELPPAAPNENK